MATHHLIRRTIGIDAGHRVTYHGSKCRNLHGHRYEVEAVCRGPLAESGEQQGMVLDFGFLKDEMMTEIDAPCDHGLILWAFDPLLGMFNIETKLVTARVIELGALCVLGIDNLKLYVVSFVPTAENLARHWAERLAPRVRERSGGRATLVSVRVHETPNCWAQFDLSNGE